MKRLVLLAIASVFILVQYALADNICDHAMQFVPISVATAATTQLVAPVTNQRIVVCGYDFTIAGTSPTYEFEYGTGSTCGTGTTAMTGTYAPTSGTQTHFGGGDSPIMATASGQGLCLVNGGTGSPAVDGVLDYVIIQ